MLHNGYYGKNYFSCLSSFIIYNVYKLKFDYISFIRRLNFYHLRIVLMQWARFLRANPDQLNTELIIEILQRRNTRKFAEKFLSDKDNSTLVQILENVERLLILQI